MARIDEGLKNPAIRGVLLRIVMWGTLAVVSFATLGGAVAENLDVSWFIGAAPGALVGLGLTAFVATIWFIAVSVIGRHNL
jgi:hypothetical protein